MRLRPGPHISVVCAPGAGLDRSGRLRPDPLTALARLSAVGYMGEYGGASVHADVFGTI
jgi:hypothetical protein